MNEVMDHDYAKRIRDHGLKTVFFTCTNTTLETHKCKNCNFETYLKINYHKHMTMCPTKMDEFYPVNTCKKCKLQTHSQLILMKHKSKGCIGTKVVIENIIFRCDECPFETKYHRIFNCHMVTEHGESEDTRCLKYEQYLNNPLWIATLRKRFTGKHVKMLQCNQCSHTTTSKFLMEVHVQSRHVAIESIKWFRCPHCPYKAKWNFTLRRHEKSHRLPKLATVFQCDYCPYKTECRSTLNRHVETKHRTSESKFKCEQCSFRSHVEGNLRQHVSIKHANIQKIQCENCDFKTLCHDELKEHQLSLHTSPDNVFHCNECKFKTRWSFSLRKHVVSKHTGEYLKKYLCDKCPFKTQRKTSLNKHKVWQHSSLKEGAKLRVGKVKYSSFV